MMKSVAVFGIVRTQSVAGALITELQTKGFALSDISVLFPDEVDTRKFAHTEGTKAPEGAVIGGSTGGVAGGVLGLLVGIGMLAIPGLGLLVAAGPLMAALSGVAVGATVGSITGALAGLGVPEMHAQVYEGKLKGGHILISVHIDDRSHADLAREAFAHHGAEDIAETQGPDAPATSNVPLAASQTPLA